MLARLYLKENYIENIDPEEILIKFLRLNYLNLNKNPLKRETINQFRAKAQETDRNIEIIANNIGLKYANPAKSTNPTKKRKTKQ